MALYRFDTEDCSPRIIDTNEYFRGTDEEWDLIWKHLLPSGPGDVLDAGCGEHIWGCTNWNVERCDNWQKYITRTDAPAESVEMVDLENKWPYSRNSFGGVIAVDVIEHMENIWHFFREAFRVAEDFVIVATPNVESAFSHYCFMQSGWLWSFCPKEIERSHHLTPVFRWQVEKAAQYNSWIVESVTYTSNPHTGVCVPEELKKLGLDKQMPSRRDVIYKLVPRKEEECCPE